MEVESLKGKVIRKEEQVKVNRSIVSWFACFSCLVVLFFTNFSRMKERLTDIEFYFCQSQIDRDSPLFLPIEDRH